MKTTDNTVEINSVEELTLHALDHTKEGLETLAADTRRCGDALQTQNPDGFKQLSELVVNLKEFDVFEHELCSFFHIDRNTIHSTDKSLQASAEEFRLILQDLLEKLQRSDIAGVAGILKADLSNSLDGFINFIPLLKKHIRDEYMESEA